jgi:hypothetical protein
MDTCDGQINQVYSIISFQLMLTGESFDIEELYCVNKEVYPFIGRFIVSDMKKQIQKK